MAIDETRLTKGLVRKLNALRKSVGDDLAEEVFAKWLEREAAAQGKEKPDPVAMKIVETFVGFENDPKFNLGNYGYTLRRAKAKARRALSQTRMKRQKKHSPRPLKLSWSRLAKKGRQLCPGRRRRDRFAHQRCEPA